MAKKVLIVGGVAGGASTAARLRRVDEHAEIIMFEKDEYISFANCGLPYYIGGVIEERDKLLVQTPESMKRRFNIDVRARHEVVRIDRDNKKVEVKDHRTGKTYTEDYDYLVLAPGAEPAKLPMPGVDKDNVFTLRNIPDTDAIHSYIAKNEPRSAVVVGGGFIGLEMVENLKARGLEVHLVELQDQVLPSLLDREVAAVLEEHLQSKGVALHLGTKVKEINGDTLATGVLLSTGERIPADMVFLAAGVRPKTELARDAGLDLSPKGAIRVDEQLRTSDPHIFAVGDAVEVKHVITGRPCYVPLAGPANRQGRIAANAIAGREDAYAGVQGTAIIKAFDMTFAATGLTEEQLNNAGIDHHCCTIHSGSHAGYYPGAFPLSIKLMFAPDGQVLGAQVFGFSGVDKRIDVLATALRLRANVFQLQEIDLAYAPPFGSAKDPVNMVGYVAANIINGDMDVIQWHELPQAIEEGALILDVREPQELAFGSIPGAVNIPLDKLRGRLDELPRDKRIVVYCQVGLRAYLALRILRQHDFENVQNLTGGWKTLRPVLPILGLADESGDQVSPSSHTDAAEGGKGAPTGESPVKNVSALTVDVAAGDGQSDGAGGDEYPMSPDAARRSEPRKVTVDACGLQCPGPIMQVYQAMSRLEEGDLVEALATDPGFLNDISAWCESTGNALLETRTEEDRYVAVIAKGQPVPPTTPENGRVVGQDKTLVVFSGDLDKAIASFIIANGAAAMGRKVTMFFTFWGLNVLRRCEKVPVDKPLLDRMFGRMMPKGSQRLGLSKMNMLGMGARMIRYVMGRKNVGSLEDLIEQAKRNGVRLVACQMSMDIMGIKKEELIDGVEIGGVASYLSAAEKSNVNLFI